MSQTILSPDELRRFANYLDSLIESLREKKFNTSNYFEHLRQTWKDPKYDQFEKTFSATCQDLEQFLKTTKSYADFLRRKAAMADRYLDRM